jgi:hypothetical protein
MLKLYESCAKNTTRDQNIRRLWWLNLCCHVLLRCVRRPLMKPLPQTPAVFQPPRAERGPHAPWATCAWESHAFFFSGWVLGDFVLMGYPKAAEEVRGGACATRVGDQTVPSSGSFWASVICTFFLYVYSCLFTVYLCNGL